MSMSKSHFLAGLLGVCALTSCPDNQYYDTPYGQYGNRSRNSPYGPARPTTLPAYGQPTPSGQPAPAPYGTPQPGTPSAPGIQNPTPYGPSPYGPAPAPAPTPGSRIPNEYPVAQRTTNPDQVISPFDPKRVIDISGYKSGQLVRDPENKKIFRVP